MSGLDIAALLRKLYAGCSGVAAHADRFYNEIPKLQQRAAYAEAAQAAMSFTTTTTTTAAATSPVSARASLVIGDGGTGTTLLVMPKSAPGGVTAVDDLTRARHELVALQTKFQTVLQQIKEQLICPICTEVAVVPKVLGVCGHIACQNCLKTVRTALLRTTCTRVLTGFCFGCLFTSWTM